MSFTNQFICFKCKRQYKCLCVCPNCFVIAIPQEIQSEIASMNLPRIISGFLHLALLNQETKEVKSSVQQVISTPVILENDGGYRDIAKNKSVITKTIYKCVFPSKYFKKFIIK